MFVNNLLPRSKPETLGISSTAILSFLDEVEGRNLELHSFMLLRHGHVAAEGWWSPYGTERPHLLFSLSKSFTSTGIGMAVAEGKLSIDDSVISFFPCKLPMVVSENLASMKICDLLSMSTGHAEDTINRMVQSEAGNWVEIFLGIPVDHIPGTHFIYNSGATYMLSAIIQKVTGQKLLDYLKPRLFDLLGITGATWDACPDGINAGGWGLSLKTEDIAKFGQLYIQKGLWDGNQILSSAWVEEATSKHISNGDGGDSDWAQGYGYQFWNCRHGAYRGDGAFGQYCVVMPEQDAVVAITGALDDMQVVLNLIWEHLLPAMIDTPITCKEKMQAELAHKLNTLALQPPRFNPYSVMADRVSGKMYKIDENEFMLETVSLQFDRDSFRISLSGPRGEFYLSSGLETWVEGETDLFRTPFIQNTACYVASGTWKDENTFTLTIRLFETPFYETWVLQFEGDALRIDSAMNVNMGPKERMTIQGRLK
jgi:CubicO group peptidase (beta-lactamase class C family)